MIAVAIYTIAGVFALLIGTVIILVARNRHLKSENFGLQLDLKDSEGKRRTAIRTVRLMGDDLKQAANGTGEVRKLAEGISRQITDLTAALMIDQADGAGTQAIEGVYREYHPPVGRHARGEHPESVEVSHEGSYVA